VAAGLLAFEEGGLRSPIRISGLDGLLVIHDPLDVHGMAGDHVAGIGPATRTLAGLTVRVPVARALDLGTGCGIQALLATRHADEVVATDLNPRAVQLARLSATLNERHLDLRLGSLFEPVDGERFGLIAANPPFVVSPDTELVFRDGDVAGDSISPSVVTQAPALLDDGGFATVLCSWIRRAGETWSTAPEAWVDGGGCDAWLLHHRSDDPLAYATNWNAFIRHDPDTYAAAVRRWLDYYRASGVEAIETGAVILRRRSGCGWVKLDEMPNGPCGDGTDHVLRVFAARDDESRWSDDRAMLAATVDLVGPHRLEQVLTHDGDRYATHPSHLRLDQGVGLAEEVPPNLVQLLLMLDGTRPLGDVASDAAESLGADPAAYGREAADLIRRLHASGFATLS
jgi:methylase of polypeptide subunit release factors